jgi:cyclophilin family peptidyl-prolyl cis-trans isomerase
MVLDGYNAPVTAGNFVDLINKGYYNKKPIDRADGFVVQMGDNDPSGTVHGYVPSGSSSERKIPLEVSLKGDKDLLFGISSEDEGRGAVATVLPFQAYGALGMAREEFDAESASTQFFWLLFESDLTPAGKNLLDGRYTLFGYTVENADLLKDVKEGDIISSAKVLSGGENLSK